MTGYPLKKEPRLGAEPHADKRNVITRSKKLLFRTGEQSTS